jgi:hypothetical protein
MLALTAFVVLAGVLAMLLVSGNMLERRLDDRVDDVQGQFDTSLGRLRQDVRKELEARLPAAGAVPPSATATPTATATPERDGTPDRGATATPSRSATPGATATPTPSPDTEIRP